jgi:flagellar FliJ protein
MTAIRFRLERVRALREQREDQAKQQLAKALQRQADGEAQLEQAQADVSAAQATWRGPEELLSATTLVQRQAYLERVERKQQQAKDELTRRSADSEQRRRVLTGAAQEHQALERLKQKRIAEQQHEQNLAEQRILDEIAGNQHWRNAA